MTNVHLFRHVWCGVINHNGLWLSLSHTEARQLNGLFSLFSQPVAIEENIDEARPGDLYFAGDARQVKMLQNGFS